jgi:sporulation protein YlmC with PRC-barrel domain
MATNAFEDSRISEGTMHIGAQHVSNIPVATPWDDPGKRFASTSTPTDAATDRPVRRVLGVTMLTGAEVRNPAGESLGKLEDIMIDLAAGRIAYAVLSFGGLLGIGSKFFILPWSSMTFNQTQNEFILDIPREVLEKGPGFDKNNWPDMGDPAYGASIHRHYGQTPYWENTATNFSGDEFSGNRCRE